MFSKSGVFSTLGDTISTSGDIMSTTGDIMSTSGDVQYIGGYYDACGYYDTISTLADIQYIRGDSMSTLADRDIMSTSGIFSTSGDIMMHVGEQNDKSLSSSFENPDVLMISPDILNISRCTHDLP